MDYFNNVFSTFLGLETSGNDVAAGWFRKFLDFIKNILIFGTKMNKCLTVLERHEHDVGE